MTSTDRRPLFDANMVSSHSSLGYAAVETVNGVDFFDGLYSARDVAAVVRIRTAHGRAFRAERVAVHMF